MTTERIDIVVSEKGSRTVKRNIANISTGADKAASSVKKLQGLLLSFAGGAALVKLVKISDTFVTLDTRLKNVTNSTFGYNKAFDSLFKTAQKNGDVFEGLVDTYSKLNNSVSDNIKKSFDLVKVTQLLSRGFAVSGTSAATAAGASLQLTQGLATNFKAAGQELNSIIEGAPLLARLIAHQLGGDSAADLKILAEQGKLTTESFLEALIATESALKAFEIPKTISRAIRTVRNEFLRLVGQSDAMSGAAGVLSDAIRGLAKNLELLIKISLTGLALALKKVLAGFALTSVAFLKNKVAITSQKIAYDQLTASMAVNNRMSAAVSKAQLAAAGTTSLNTIAVNRIGQAGVVAASNVGKLRLAFTGLKIAGAGLLALVGGIPGLIFAAVTAVIIFRKELSDLFNKFQDLTEGTFLGRFVGNVQAMFIGMAAVIGGTFAGIFEVIKSGLNNLEFEIFKLQAKLADSFIGKKLGVEVPIIDDFEDKLNRTALGAGENFAKGFGDFGELIEGAIGKKTITFGDGVAGGGVAPPTSVTPKGLGDSKENFADLFRDLTRENSLLKLNSDEREAQSTILQFQDQLKRDLTETEVGLIRNIIDENSALQLQSDILQDLRAPQENLAQGQDALNALFDQGKISAEEYSNSLRELTLQSLEASTTFDGGVQRGLLRIQEQFTDMSSLVENSLVNAFQSAEDALVKFVSTGKVDFKSLTDSIIADINRMIIRDSITAPLANILGAGAGGGGDGAAGGIFGDIGNLFGFHQGGDFTVGADTSVGSLNGVDNRLVAFRARDGENVSVTRAGEGGGGGNAVNVNFNISTPDANSFQQSQGQIMAKTQAALERANRRNN